MRWHILSKKRNVKKQTHSARKMSRTNVMPGEIINFASKICRTCLKHGDAISV